MKNTKTDLSKLFDAFEDGASIIYREVDSAEKRVTFGRCIIDRIELRNDAIDFIGGRDIDGNLIVFSDSIQTRPYMSATKIVPLDGILFSMDEYTSKN